MEHDPRCRYAWNPREQNCDCVVIARVVADCNAESEVALTQLRNDLHAKVGTLRSVGHQGHWVERAKVLALIAGNLSGPTTPNPSPSVGSSDE